MVSTSNLISLIALLFGAYLVRADHLKEIRVKTGDNDGDGMAPFFGQLSVKVEMICNEILTTKTVYLTYLHFFRILISDKYFRSVVKLHHLHQYAVLRLILEAITSLRKVCFRFWLLVKFTPYNRNHSSRPSVINTTFTNY